MARRKGRPDCFYSPCATAVQTVGWSHNTSHCALSRGRETKAAQPAVGPRHVAQAQPAPVGRQARTREGKKEQWGEILGQWKM